jgi:hypothetical protein
MTSSVSIKLQSQAEENSSNLDKPQIAYEQIVSVRKS